MGEQFKYSVNSINELKAVAEDISNQIQKFDIKLLLMSGEMGAGKTTLIKELCIAMEVIDTVTSPTFSLVNEYSTIHNEPIFHFDIYRIDSVDEIIDLGYEEYIYSGYICLIEWWKKIENLIPTKSENGVTVAELEIEIISPSSREITLTVK